MAIELISIVPRNERRVRLVFTSALASGAFGSPAPGGYTITGEDGAANVTISAAIIVSGSTSNVELALAADLIEGGLYRVRALGIPGGDATTSTTLSDQRFRFGVSTNPPGREPKTSDRDLLLYGRDLVFSGLDYLETADLDLATVDGAENALGALTRRLLGAPLPWAPDYSPRAREFVDIPLPSVTTLRGRLEQQALRDDRVREVKATLVLDDDEPSSSYFTVTPKLTGGQPTEPVNVHVFV